MKREPTQQQRILDYISNNGFIDAFKAMWDLGIMQLATRIHELEQDGYQFNRIRKRKVAKAGYKFSYVEYRLNGEPS